MKIINEFIVLNSDLQFIKVVLLESGDYFEYNEDGRKYEQVSSEWFEECKQRMTK